MVADPQFHDPYVGPRPFEQQDIKIFFGRDREINELLSLIIAHRVVLLYAQSGTGKTSILNAGVIPHLKEEGFEVLPVTRVQGHIPTNFDINDETNPYVLNTLISWLENVKSYERLAQVSIPEFMIKRPHPKDKDGVQLPHIAVFDQFEELFTSYLEHWKGRETFFKQVGEALEQDPNFRVVFVMREDYIAQLDPFVGFLPDKLRTRYRLERMRQEAALLAVTEPIKSTSRTFAEGVPQQLVAEMLKISVETPEQTMIVAGEYVEPVQLQVVCQSLWRSLPKDVQVITQDHLKSFGDVNQALSNFYERCLKQTVRLKGVQEGNLRSWFESELITPSGTRGTVYRGKENTGGIRNEAVDELENLHLIRAEYRAGARWYELTHDRFIDPIQKSNGKWRGVRRKRILYTVVALIGILVPAAIFIVSGAVAQNVINQAKATNDFLATQAAYVLVTESAAHSMGTEIALAQQATLAPTQTAGYALTQYAAFQITLVFNSVYATQTKAAEIQVTSNVVSTIQKQQTSTAEAQAVLNVTATAQAQSSLQEATNTPQPTLTPTPTLPEFSTNLVTANNQWKPLEQIFNGVQMVLVPAGCFAMGSEQGQANEQPVNQQCFDVPFWIDRYEVTNKQFTTSGQYAGDNHPRDSVNWIDAWTFCDQRGARLPTEREWEYAARGPDNLKYPWGNNFVASNVVYSRNSSQTADVGSKPGGVSWVGAYDLSGNVFEWVSSIYSPYPYSADDGRENFGGDTSTSERVLRGGSFANNVSILGASYRLNDKPDDVFKLIGFRCARTFVGGDLVTP